MYLGSKISSAESDVNIRLDKAWATFWRVINHMENLISRVKQNGNSSWL